MKKLFSILLLIPCLAFAQQANVIKLQNNDITGPASPSTAKDLNFPSGTELKLKSGSTLTIEAGANFSITGLNATSIADGSVSNTEFQYINSLTSNAQTQLSFKSMGAMGAADSGKYAVFGSSGELQASSSFTVWTTPAVLESASLTPTVLQFITSGGNSGSLQYQTLTGDRTWTLVNKTGVIPAVASSTGAVNLSGSEVTGTLPVASGGTNIASYTAGDTLYASGATTLAKLAKGTGLQVYRMNAGATAPEWATLTTGLTIGDAISGGTNNQMLIKDASGNLGQSSSLTFASGVLTDIVATGSVTVGDSGADYISLGSSATRELRLTSNAFGLGSSQYGIQVYDSGVGLGDGAGTIYFSPLMAFRGGMLAYADINWNTGDLGIGRASAGVLKITDGSTGYGSLTANGITIEPITGTSTLTMGGTSAYFPFGGSQVSYNYSVSNGFKFIGATNTGTPFVVSSNNGVDIFGFLPTGTGITRLTDGGAGYGSLILANLTQTAGSTLSISSGSNQRAGNATLVGGTVTVNNTTVTSNTVVILTRKTSGGVTGELTYTVSAATSFTINASVGTDTSTVSYLLIEVP